MAWIGAAISVVGGLIASDSAGSAADAQRASTDAAVAENRRQADRSYTDTAPYRAAGADALGQLQTGINTPTTAADVMSDPGYKFGMDQGQQALDRKAAAAGGRISGASLKAASRFGTDYASTGFNAAYQRRQDRLNRLAAVAGIGQTATSASAASGAASTNAITGLLSSQGDATGASRLAQGNIWAGAGNQIAAAFGRRTPGAVSNPYGDSMPTGGYGAYGGSVSGGYSGEDGARYNNPSAYTGP